MSCNKLLVFAGSSADCDPEKENEEAPAQKALEEDETSLGKGMHSLFPLLEHKNSI